MGIKAREQAIIDLVINGQQARTSLRELAGAYNAVWAEASRLREEENPARYAELQRQLARVGAARDAERDRLRGVTRAIQEQRDENKGFFSDFKKGFSDISEMAGSITAGTLLYKGISAGLSYIKQIWDGSEEAYKEAELTQAALQNKFDQTGNAVGRNMKALQDLQQTVMDQTGVDDDIIAKGEDVVLSYQNITGTIYDQVIPAAVNLTSAQNKGIVTMDGMSSSSDLLGKILERPANAKKKLMKIGVDLTDQMDSEIKTLVKQNKLQDAQQIILDQVNKRYGDLAKTLANTETGELQRYQTRLGNIQEVFGKWIVSGKGVMVEFLSPFLTLIEKFTTTKMSETLEKDRIALMANTVQLESSNLSHSSRINIINTLKEKYPEYLSKIDAEKAKNSDLIPILNKINEALVLRIAFQKKSEGLQDAVQEEADAMLRLDNASQNLSKTMGAIMARFADKGLRIIMPQGLTDLEQAEYLMGKIKENGRSIRDPKSELQALKVAASYVKEYTSAYKAAGAERTKFLNDQQRFAKQYGFNAAGDDQATQKYNAEHPGLPPTTPTDPSNEEKSAAAKKLEAFKKLLEETRVQADQLAESARKGTVDDLDAQIRVIENKYKKVVDSINKLLKDPHTTPDIRKELNNRLAMLKTDEGLEVDNKRDAFAKEQQAKAKKDRDDEFKAATSRVDNIYDTGQSELDKSMSNDLTRVTDSDPAVVEAKRLNIQEAYAQKKFELEQQHLADMKMIYETYGESTSALDKKIADNTIKENDRAAKTKLDKDKAYVAAQRDLQQYERDTAQQGAQLLESVLDERSALYKAALIADKTMAIANIIMSTEVAIGKFAASVAYLGPVGAALAAKYAVTAHISEGFAIGAIIKSAADGLGGNKKKAAKGGVFTGPGHDNGGLDVVDPRTGATVVNVEGGEPWMVLSRETRRNNGALINELLFNSMYRNGAKVDVPRISGGLRQARNGALMSPNQSSAGDASVVSKSGNHDERFARIEDNLSKVSDLLDRETRRPISLNYRVFKQAEDRVAEIDNNANG